MKHFLNQTITHHGLKDVAFFVNLRCLQRENGDLYLDGTWINIVNPNNHYPIGQDAIVIKQKDVEKWQIYVE